MPTLLPLLLAAVHAAPPNVELGGAVDLMAGVTTGEGGAVGSFGLRQLEGDLLVGGDEFAFNAQLDIAATFSGEGIFLYSIAPERLVVEGGGKGWKLEGGVFPGYFRMESVDPWRSNGVVTSLAARRLPATILGAGAQLGDNRGGVDLFLGAQPSTVDVFKLDDGPVALPFIAGARGRIGIQPVRIAGGAWFGGNLGALGVGGMELGFDAALGVVTPYGEFVSDLRDGHAGFLGADLFPDAVVTPGARVELDSQLGFGVGVGAATTLFDILRLKLEANYQAGHPGLFLEVALFSKAPIDDDPRGFVDHPAPVRKAPR